jgi:glycosyltransferase involved in cell wall biosynthesis
MIISKMKQLNHPLVSIITPGWNGKTFIHHLLDSILSQTYDNIEYIYVDDGSSDGTKDVVLSYKDKFESRGIPFMYVYKENGGLCSAIQEGLQHVSGECLCWPEYDDILLPTAIEERVKYLESHSDCAVVTCDAWITPVDSLDKPTGVLSYHNPNRFDRNHFVQLLTGNSIFTAACHMVRMDVFDETHKDRKIFQSRVGAVWQMLLPIYYKYNRGFIDKPLVKWVQRKDSISNKVQNINEVIKGSKELLKIRVAVLDSIPMLVSDRELYKKIAGMNNADSFMRKGIALRSKKLFYIGYNYYKDNNIPVSNEIILMKYQIGNNLFFYIIKWYEKIVEKMKRMPLKIVKKYE